jgi:ABC-type transporter Mla MlaB component
MATHGRPRTNHPAVPPTPDDEVAVVVIGGRIGPADVPALWERVGALLECAAAATVVCDVRTLTDPDLGTVDALARLVLAGRRVGCRVQLRHVPGELRQLFVLVGLAEVVGLPSDLRLQGGGQAEQGEHACGVQEGVDPGDPPV